METQVVLCADSESLHNPYLVGLEGEALSSQTWLRVFCSAVEARNYLKESSFVKEVWVASSDDMDPINLAAALKKDSFEKSIYLLAFQGSGSLKSRANAAGLSGTLNQQEFAARYASKKQSESQIAPEKVPDTHNPSENTSVIPFELATQRQKIQEPPARSFNGVPTATGKSAYIISVVGASGGVGKSTISALVALFSQGLGHKTLLLDADLQFGDMRYLLGEENPLTIDRVLHEPSRLTTLKPLGLKPALLAAPAHLEQSEVIVGELPQLLEYLKATFDVVVVNTGAFWSEQHAALLERSSTSLFLVDQRSSSLRACKHALDLCVRCGIATHPVLFALNRCTRNAPLTSIDVSCALQGAHVIELPDGGKEVNELLAAGLPFELINTRNDLCLSIEKMLLELLPGGALGENKGEPAAKETKRFRFSKRRRRVACL